MSKLLMIIWSLIAAIGVDHLVNCLSDVSVQTLPVQRYLFDLTDAQQEGVANDGGSSRLAQTQGPVDHLTPEARAKKKAQLQKCNGLVNHNPVRQFVVHVLITHQNSDKTSICHGTVISNRHVLVPSECLGNQEKNPVRTARVFNATFNETFDLVKELMDPDVATEPKIFQPKYELLSWISKVCVVGSKKNTTDRGRFAMLLLNKPLKSFEQLELAKSKPKESKEFGSLKLCPLNSTILYRWAAVQVTNCPARIKDDAIVCFERDARAYSVASSPWQSSEAICQATITGAPIVGGKEGKHILYGILGAQRRLCYDRFIYAANIANKRLSDEIERLKKNC